MHTCFLLERFKEYGSNDAIIWKNKAYSYEQLLDRFEHSKVFLDSHQIQAGSIVVLEGDFTPKTLALMLALIDRACLIVPLTSGMKSRELEVYEIAQAQFVIAIDAEDQATVQSFPTTPTHELLLAIQEQKHPGLILFSSGSTGKSKATVHNFSVMLKKFSTNRKRAGKRMMGFLFFDHIGGINTLLSTLASGGCIVTLQDRSPDEVCASIAKHNVQVLPASPTFLNLLLLSEAYKRHDLSSLELINYGTEAMTEHTLAHMNRILPQIKLLQSYGMSEIGIIRSSSQSSNSLWMKFKGEDYETRIVDGLLEVKSEFTMLGYLNAESRFTNDGWYRTGDAVECNGEYIRILGRQSEMINIGGEKIYPIEIENVLLEMEEVVDVSVCGEKHIITGTMITATIQLNYDMPAAEFRKRMRTFCKDRLPSWGIPQKCLFVQELTFGNRLKKKRVQSGGEKNVFK